MQHTPLRALDTSTCKMGIFWSTAACMAECPYWRHHWLCVLMGIILAMEPWLLKKNNTKENETECAAKDWWENTRQYLYSMPAHVTHVHMLSGRASAPHGSSQSHQWPAPHSAYTNMSANVGRSQLVLPSENDSRGRAFFLFKMTSCSSRTRRRSPSSRRCRSSRILRCSSTSFSCSSAYRQCDSNETHTQLSWLSIIWLHGEMDQFRSSNGLPRKNH